MKTNKCSLKVFKDGRKLSGTAAILHATSRAGGFDKYLENFAQEVAKLAVEEHINNEAKPKLRVI